MIRHISKIVFNLSSQRQKITVSLFRRFTSTDSNRRQKENIPDTSTILFFQEHHHFKRNFKYYVYGLAPLLYYLYNKKYLDFQFLPVARAISVEPTKSIRSQYNFIADTVEKSSGAVVCIEIKDSHRLDFFQWGQQTMSNGSGFIINEDGLILTNAHVVSGHPHSIIQVRLADGSTYEGHVEAMDIYTDLATIRIQPKKKLPVLKLGGSKDLRPGEFVIAMGSPLTLSNTVTSGIVSSTHRKSSELHLGNDMHYIQTDASITFGNSGGPLINLDGEVVGINSMKVAQAGGISFAIPVEFAKDFLDRSKQKPSPKIYGNGKRYLGLTLITLSPEIIREIKQRYLNVPHDLNEGALVWKVVVGSPAYKSGLIPGDIVVDINGKHVSSSNAIYQALETDNSLVMKIFRADRFYEVQVHPEDIM